MKRFSFLFLSVVMLLIMTLGCSKTPSSGEALPPSDEYSEPTGPAHPDDYGDIVRNPTLSMLPEENQNIPKGSNVVKIGDKWIVAANIDADYYQDTCFRQMHFYVVSREPMNPETISLQFEKPISGLNVVVTDNIRDYVFPSHPLYFAYNQVDWKLYRAWAVWQVNQFQAGESLSAVPDEFSDLQGLNSEASSFPKNGVEGKNIYDIWFWFDNIEAEEVVHTATISWPGIIESIDIGEIRLHPQPIYDEYESELDLGMEFTSYASAGSSSTMFGPELACSVIPTIKAENEVIIKSVKALNPNYQVVGVTVCKTERGLNDQVHVTPNNPVIISPGAEAEMRIYFTGPHLSEITVMGQGYFAIDCEVEGIDYQLLWEGGQQREVDPYELYAVLMDNVDLQGYYECLFYDPTFGWDLRDNEVYQIIGWTEKWEAMMAN